MQLLEKDKSTVETPVTAVWQTPSTEPGAIPKAGRFLKRYGFALIASLWAFTAGIVFRKNRDLICKICGHFGFGMKNGHALTPQLPEKPVAALLTEEPGVRVLEPRHARGNVSLFELLAICKLVKQFRPRAMFEIGTFDGRTSLNLAANGGDGAVVYTLDLPGSQANTTGLPLEAGDKSLIEKESSGDRYKHSAERGRIRQLFGDSATFDFSPYFGAIDLIFIDGAHSYEYVLNDTRIALKLLRNGSGVILWHDYGSSEGVIRALDELAGTDPKLAGMVRIKETNLVFIHLGGSERT